MDGTSREDPWPSEAWPRSQPPPYSYTNNLAPPPKRTSWLYADPRESSTQSLVPSSIGDLDGDSGRRRLLVIYIHGFYGNDQSFCSFPAHVHDYLKEALHDSHAVHSKIYPRYKTYKAIDIAVENFSAWLKPHENAETDVILIGHSMGGILAAEIALLVNRSPYSSQRFRHRILGTISMDCPFLGLHPGIVVSGISSLFRPADKPPTPVQGESLSPILSPVITGTSASDSAPPTPFDSNSSFAYTEQSSFMSPLTQPLTSEPSTPNVDPFFNAPFFNDVSFKERPFTQRLIRFFKKHRSEGIFGAAKNHILSHLEYGGCLADYPALHYRYNRVRALEDIDELQTLRKRPKEQSNSGGNTTARVRFVNYYTVSTGRPKPKKPGSPPPEDQGQLSSSRSSAEKKRLDTLGSEPLDPSRVSTPAIQIESPGSEEKTEILPPHIASDALTKDKGAASALADQKSGLRSGEPRYFDSRSTDELCGCQPGSSETKLGQISSISQETVDLPAIPDLPESPPPPNLTRYSDEDSHRQAEKKSKRELKTYVQAAKNRDKALNERQMLLDKRRKKSEKARAKLEKEAEKQKAKEEKEKRKKSPEARDALEQRRNDGPSDTFSPPVGEGRFDAHTPGDVVPDHEAPLARAISPAPKSDTDLPIEVEAKRVKAAKPLKERKFCVLPRKPDRTWVRVFMEGVDEVGAHCGLFIAEAPHYDGLIRDFGQRIVHWVRDDMTKKAILQLAEGTDDLSLD